MNEAPIPIHAFLLAAADVVWAARDLRSTLKLVLLRLIACSEVTDGRVSVSIAALSAATGLSDVAVRNALRELRKLRVVELTRNEDPSIGATREYQIHFHKILANQTIDHQRGSRAAREIEAVGIASMGCLEGGKVANGITGGAAK